MSVFMTEDDLEQKCLELLKSLGYKVINGLDIAPDGVNPERKYDEVVLINRLKEAINRINPKLPKEAREEAVKKVLRSTSQKLIEDNHDFHQMLVNGVDVEYRKEGRVVGDKVWLIDYDKQSNNEFLAINQYTIIENNNNRRPDVILFINGLPLVLIELKNPADQEATVKKAYNQLQTYKNDIPSVFKYNEILIISDGLDTRAGTINAKWERFNAWKTINEEKQSNLIPEIEVLLKGMANKETLIDLVRNFITFEKEKTGLIKKLAAYHQYNAVNKAIKKTIDATKTDHKCGVVWHTQGSGKSLTMIFYTGKLVLSLDNPTIIVINDRNDLDDQLFNNFKNNHELLRQKPVQAETREQIKELLNVSSGGVIFTTIQKFFPEDRAKYPELSKRSNVIVIADEAHRTQYGFSAKVIDKKEKGAVIGYGYAKYVRDALPNASFIAFTGTPIEKQDRSTRQVFGKNIDVYDIQQAVDDKVTVKIYYENRLVKLELKPEEMPKIDPQFEEVTEGQEVEQKEKLKSKWAQMEKLVGSPRRIKRLAKDIVKHFEERLKVLDGKGIIVCMSRRICVELYNEIVKLRPEWHSEDDKEGFLKVVMTGSASDPVGWQQHIRNKKRRRELGDYFKEPENPIKLVIVRDMWLTGFDVPSLHTMYNDKPMKGHGLMQAIARVNRVYKDKTGGLIVDYLGIAPELKKALSEYTESDKKQTGIPINEAINLMLSKYEVVKNLFHGFNYKKFFEIKPTDRMSFILESMDYVLKQKDGKDRFLKSVTSLLQSFALVVPHQEAMKLKEEVAFFQAIKSSITKNTEVSGKFKDEFDSAIKQIVSRAIVSDRVIDIFEAAGISKPDVSLLSPEFLAEVRELPQKNLAFEALKKLLNDEIRLMSKKNLVKSRSFMELLQKTIKRYTNKSIEAAQVIEELIELAKTIQKDTTEGKKLGLSEEEVAFYDALADNDSAVQLLGDETLRKIAVELTEMIRRNVTIDWTLRENVQAKLRVMVKKILRKYDYPPDKQENATKTVLEQAKLIAKDWAEA